MIGRLTRPQARQDHFVLRELVVHLALVPELLAIRDDDEVPAAAGDQVQSGVWKLGANRGGQTGRPRFVVSLHAVLDADVHGRFSRGQCVMSVTFGGRCLRPCHVRPV